MSFYGGARPEYTCPWGIRWRWARNGSGEYTEIVGPPLADDRGKLDTFQMPDPEEESQYDAFLQRKALYGKEKWVDGSSQISVFEWRHASTPNSAQTWSGSATTSRISRA